MRFCLLAFICILACPLAVEAFSLSQDEIRAIPTTGVKKIVHSNGEVYLVAACEEEKIQGIPSSRVLEMAALKARTTLAQFIYGETFEQILRESNYSASVGKVGTTSSSFSREIISRMKDKALKEVEVILEDKSKPETVLVVVGVRIEPIQ